MSGSGEILDWKGAIARLGNDRGLYAGRLRAFMGTANDSLATVFAALNRGDADQAQTIVHEVRTQAAELGAKALSARALELEMAIKAGADTQFVYGRFSSAVPDTLCSISGYLAQ